MDFDDQIEARIDRKLWNNSHCFLRIGSFEINARIKLRKIFHTC